MTLRLTDSEQAALRERAEAEGISMQDAARRAVREFVTRGQHRDHVGAAVNLIMVVASLVSLVSVVVGLAKAKQVSGSLSTVLTSIAVLTVFLSWFTVHTLFVLRYAHLYYSKPVGGIDFANTKESPDYMDFVYVAFTVGMTFQVSDTGIAQRSIRRTVIRQGLLSYVFGTVIFGVTINVVGNLFR